MLGRDRDLDLVLLPQIASLSESAVGGLSQDQFSWIRPFLADEDWRVRREAALALGRMQDHRSYEELVGCLSDEQRLVQQAGLWALRRMSGKNFDDDAAGWRSWFAEESHWFETRGVVLIESLRDADPAIVIDAVRELVQRPLFKHETAEALAVTLRNPNPLVVTGAAAALAELGSVRAVRPLCEALSSSDGGARRAAHAALVRLTGHTWPLDSDEWPRLANG
jgi:HEAT repeat protein